MPSAYFFQDCPTCGRHVRIKAEYLGRRVSCLHCAGQFVAADRDSRFDAIESPASDMLPRLESFLSLGPVVSSPAP